jgi:hypothetical protein
VEERLKLCEVKISEVVREKEERIKESELGS